jgi:hypothetical protein
MLEENKCLNSVERLPLSPVEIPESAWQRPRSSWNKVRAFTYQAIVQHRFKGASYRAVLVEGV